MDPNQQNQYSTQAPPQQVPPAPPQNANASPTQEYNQQGQQLTNMPLAGVALRIAANFVDSFIILIPVFIFSYLFVSLIFGSGSAGNVEIVFNLLATLTVFFYFIFLEARSGQTLGKKLFHIRVVNVDGRNASMKQSVIRNVARILDGLFLIVPLILIIFTNKKQRIGDLLASTVVIRE